MSDAPHHIALHVANVTLAAPVVGWFAGYFQGAIATLAALAALVLYSLQIYDWFKQRKAQHEQGPRSH